MDKRLHGDPDRIMEHAEAGYCLSHSEELHLCKYTRSLRSALSIAQARVSECSDREALLADNIELRSALAEKTAQVEQYRATVEEVARQRNEALDQVEKLREAIKSVTDKKLPYENESGIIRITLGDYCNLGKALAATAKK